MQQAGLFSSSFSADANVSAFNEGRRAWAVAMLQYAQTREPRLATVMVREAAEAVELEMLTRK